MIAGGYMGIFHFSVELVDVCEDTYHVENSIFQHDRCRRSLLENYCRNFLVDNEVTQRNSKFWKGFEIGYGVAESKQKEGLRIGLLKS